MILLTAFEPFNNDDINPSYEILKKINKDVSKLLLPVSYNNSKKIMFEKINEIKPSFIISLGYASSREEISIEEKAYNEMKASISDNDNVYKDGEKIIDYKDTLETKVNIKELIDNLKDDKVYKSEDPGRFICNEVYYLSLFKMNNNALFIHIPPLSTQKESGKELEYLVSLIDGVIDYIIFTFDSESSKIY